MIRSPISKSTDFFLRLASIVALVGLYFLLSYHQHQINALDTTIPNLTQFIAGFKKIFLPDAAKNIWIVEDSIASGLKLLAALFTGTLLAFVVGIGMGVYKPIESFLKWPIQALGSVPPTAMLAVYFVIFGTEFKMYIATIALGIFPSLAVAIFNAVRSDVTDHAIYKAYTLGASNLEVIWEVVVKQIMPRIIDNIRLCIGPAMVFLIAAEWATSGVGFGYRLRIQSRLTNMNIVYIYLALLGIAGFMMDWTLLQARKKICPWYDLDKG